MCTEFENDLDINSALDNYRRLQILDIESTTRQKIKDNSFRYQPSEKLSQNLELQVMYTEKLLFTDYGAKFVDVCIKNRHC